jgi:glycosyltransferase involved in cell wall biosynthesis
VQIKVVLKPLGQVLWKGTTIEEAEAFISGVEMYDPEGVDGGDYAIEAEDWRETADGARYGSLRVGIIAPPWVAVPPPGYGGTELMLDGLARGLVAAGHEVLLYTTGDSTCPVPRDWTLPEAVGTDAANPATELHHVIDGFRVLADWGADLVHDHTIVGPLYGRRFDVPLVTTGHLPFEGHFGACYRAIARDVPVIAISQTQANADPLMPIAAVIHHGIDVSAMPFGRGDGGYALFLARISPDKGVDVAARVARAAGIPLRIAGKLREPDERAYFDEKVAPLLGAGVEYLGEVGHQEKLDLLAGARCLLNPIRWPEAFGMSMIEALACGTPVVATPRGSVPELIDDGITGFVRSTEEELADALGHVNEIDRGECRKKAAASFSTERMVEQHVALYESVIESYQEGRPHTRRPCS